MIKNTVFLFLFVTSYIVFAQYDFSGLDLDGDVTSWFDQSIGPENLPIISGDYFVTRNGSKNTHRFYISNRWSMAQINYRGGEFTNVMALYDVLNDQLLIRHPTLIQYFNHPIRGPRGGFQSFTIHGHYFSYYGEEAPPAGVGFYDELFIGQNLEFIARREKETTTFKDENYLGYKSLDQYFLKHENRYFRIRSKQSIIKALNDRKKQVKDLIRQFKLQIKSDGDLNDTDIIELVKHCDKMLSET